MDKLANPEEEWDEPYDLAAETGIPREIGPGKAVLDAIGDFTQMVDIEDSLDTLNDILKRAYPDYGYRIVRGGFKL